MFAVNITQVKMRARGDTRLSLECFEAVTLWALSTPRSRSFAWCLLVLREAGPPYAYQAAYPARAAIGDHFISQEVGSVATILHYKIEAAFPALS